MTRPNPAGGKPFTSPTVPVGYELVHQYGTRTIHRINPDDGPRPNVYGAITVCHVVKVTRLDDVLLTGDYIPAKWDSWRWHRGCFTKQRKDVASETST